MSDITIHDVEERARSRLGRTYQVEALAPFPTRHDGEHWQLNREPYHHLLPPWGEPQEAAPGEEGAAPRAPAMPRPPAGAASLCATPESLAWAFNLKGTNGVGNISCASTDVIPWPFRIVGFSFSEEQNLALDGWVELNFFAVDQPLDGVFHRRVATPLIPLTSAFALGTNAFGVKVRILITSGAAVRQTQYQAIATSVIGRSVLEPNKRLVVAMYDPFNTYGNFSGHVTVERLCAPEMDFRYVAPRQPRTTTAPAPAPAPAPTAAPAPTGPRNYISELTGPTRVTYAELQAARAASTSRLETAAPQPNRQTVMYGNYAVNITVAPPVAPAPRTTTRRGPTTPFVTPTGQETVPFTY